MNETDLLFKFMADVPRILPHVRVFRREIIRRQQMISGRSGQSYFVSAGIPGQGDAYAYVRGGRVVEIEVKAAKGTMREAQKRWREFCVDWRISHIILRAQVCEEPSVTVSRWIDELSALIESLVRV